MGKRKLNAVRVATAVIDAEARRENNAKEFRVLLSPEQKAILKSLSEAYNISMAHVIRLLIGESPRVLKEVIGYDKLRLLSEQINSLKN